MLKRRGIGTQLQAAADYERQRLQYQKQLDELHADEVHVYERSEFFKTLLENLDAECAAAATTVSDALSLPHTELFQATEKVKAIIIGHLLNKLNIGRSLNYTSLLRPLLNLYFAEVLFRKMSNKEYQKRLLQSVHGKPHNKLSHVLTSFEANNLFINYTDHTNAVNAISSALPRKDQSSSEVHRHSAVGQLAGYLNREYMAQTQTKFTSFRNMSSPANTFLPDNYEHRYSVAEEVCWLLTVSLPLDQKTLQRQAQKASMKKLYKHANVDPNSLFGKLQMVERVIDVLEEKVFETVDWQELAQSEAHATVVASHLDLENLPELNKVWRRALLAGRHTFKLLSKSQISQLDGTDNTFALNAFRAFRLQ